MTDSRGAETEKITINLSVVDLGRIDLLVEQGFYSSRTDLIRAAIRTEIGRHANELGQTVSHRSLVVGVFRYDREELEALKRAGEMLDLRVVGVLEIASDVTPELARSVIKSLQVRGVLRAPAEIRAALKDRTT
jgi:Arc/MetJ-type ribon-helix-helix transcriptional regulator